MTPQQAKERYHEVYESNPVRDRVADILDVDPMRVYLVRNKDTWPALGHEMVVAVVRVEGMSSAAVRRIDLASVLMAYPAHGVDLVIIARTLEETFAMISEVSKPFSKKSDFLCLAYGGMR